ncbi:MAG TPA: 1-phosphofructokinase family hexose kinase [Candidatus Dormibacteraeota bacterium]|nr:1-phosphofructokinase family hexose kinase [Candidatus Dormibacteraeota bacterium]
MIVTITPNPSIDRTLQLPALRRGEVIRVSGVSSEAGGKGINVARSLATMGVASVAIAPASTATRARLDDLLGGSPPLRTVPIAGDIRVNLTLVEPDGTVTKVNEPGPSLDATAAARLLEDVVAAVLDILAADGDATARPATTGDVDRWVVCCGSLPPGLSDRFYAEVAACVPGKVRVAVDADRAALRAVAGSPIGLLKPNHAELEELVGRTLATFGEVADAASDLVAGGAAGVLVSLGPDGALFVDRDGASHAEASIDDLANPVGAGDALLAGFLAGGAKPSALATAVAWSVAACRAAGTRMPVVTPRDDAAVVVRPTVDRARRLRR